MSSVSAPIKKTFEQQIEQEFIHRSAIDPDLFKSAIVFIEDEGRWEPNHALNQKVSTQWQTKPPPSYGCLAAFMQENGDLWQGKPELPRIDRVKNKLIRYESPVGNGSRAFLPAIPVSIRTKISKRYGVEVPLEGSFWDWLEQHPEIPIIWTEGGKKALCLLSLGYVAIALYGVYGGYRSKSGDGVAISPELIPDVARFAVRGRKFTLAFDQDEKPKTVAKVQHALTRFGGLLVDCGCEVTIASWQAGQGKGVDDLIVQSGVAAWEKAYSEATPIAPSGVRDRDRAIAKRRQYFLRNHWRHLQKDFRLSPSKSRTIETYEGYAPTLSIDTNTILLRGWLGSGKTEATIRSLLPYKDKQIVWISGRNGLLRQTAERLHQLGFAMYHFQDNPGLYREMLRDGHPGVYLLCPDSLKNYAVKHCDWKDTILVIDEFSGIRREVLSKTEIMPEFERLLTKSHTSIAIDAFLSDVDARTISLYRPGARTLYDQTFSPSQKPIQWLETRTKDGKISMSHDGIAYGLLRQWVKEGYRIAIASDTKRDAKICAQFLKRLGVKVLLCHSETVESNQRLLHDPDQYLAESDAQVLIYSPTAQSGLDIQTHFDRGLALYRGVISPLDFLQMIGRGRKVEQWAVSAPRRSLNHCLVSSLDSPKVLKMGEKLQQSFTDLEIESSAKTRGWGLWQSLIKEIEESFHSEYLQQLLSHFFK